MENGFVDLHIHSVHSDGTYTPEEIVRRAVENGACLISVTDHNVTEGTRIAEPLARAAGLDYLPGVEIDALWRGIDIHILAYGADFDHPGLRALIDDARRKLDGMSDTLLERMLPDHPELRREEFAAFPHNPAVGGWKMLEYLLNKGLSKELTDGVKWYAQYGVRYEDAGFPPAEAVVAAIHAAGGRAVLAHPGVTLPHDDLDDFRRWLRDALALGLDGVECHYPRHGKAITRACREACDRGGLMITAGSDCHGIFNHRAICATRTLRERVRLTRERAQG